MSGNPIDEQTAEYLRRAAMERETSARAHSRAVSNAAAACPGEHEPSQHRDAKPAWCDACGRGPTGIEYATPRRAPRHRAGA